MTREMLTLSQNYRNLTPNHPNRQPDQNQQKKINYIITDTYKHSCCTRNDKVVHFEVHHLPVT